MHRLGFALLVVFLGSMSLGCDRQPAAPKETSNTVSPGPEAPAWLQDVTKTVGLQFVHQAALTKNYFMPATMGSGGALFDYDNDGRLDIYLVQNGGPDGSRNQLFHHQPDGTFKDVSAGSGLDVAGFGMGVAVGDVNNDGLPDVLLTEYGRIRLFLNLGDGRFKDVSQEAGLEDQQWATSAAFVDYDRDGWLDLVVVNYLDYSPDQKCPGPRGAQDFCGPSWFAGTATRLFHNRGVVGAASGAPHPLVRFDNATVASGLATRPGAGLGVYCGDFDGDGWPDIFIANDLNLNHLWINHHDGTFAEQATMRGIAANALGQREGNMGIAAADLRGSGLFDIFVTHLTDQPHALWRQTGAGLFLDSTDAAGLAVLPWHGTGFGAVFADFDNDGLPDLAIVNGRVIRPDDVGPSSDFWAPYRERNQLFTNTGAGKFREVSGGSPGFCGTPNIGRGLACGDVFNDGGSDLLVCATAAPATLCRDVAPHRGHWLTVRAVEPQHGGRDACGARLTLTTDEGRRLTSWANPGYSYLCSNDPRAHFGLGSTAKYASIEVAWPDGSRQTFPGGEADRVISLLESATSGPATTPAASGATTQAAAVESIVTPR